MRYIIIIAALALTSCRTLRHSESKQSKDTASVSIKTNVQDIAVRDTSVTRKDTSFAQTSVDTSKATNVTETTVTERIYPDSTIRTTHTRSTSTATAGVSNTTTGNATTHEATGTSVDSRTMAQHLQEQTAEYINEKEATDRTIPASRNIWPIVIFIILVAIIYAYIKRGL